jgi:hypothetical protein
MEASVVKFTAVVKRMKADRRRFVNDTRAGVIMGSEGALIRPSREQRVQMKSRRSLGVVTGDPRHTRAHAAKWSTAQAHCLLPIGRKYSRARHRERQTAANLTAFMAGIRRFMKVYAVLWQKLHARFSEYSFDQAIRVPGSHVATHLDVCDRVPIRTGHLTQVSNRQIERSTCPNLCACQQARNAKPSNQGGSSELQLI